MNQRFYVITGGAGVGKTALIDSLRESGCLTVPEEARRIIKEQIAMDGDGLPWKDKHLYAQLMLQGSVQSYEMVKSEYPGVPVFFDRGILDTVCYMRMENMPITKQIVHIANSYTYHFTVFILPPWKDIYHTDSERKQSWEQVLYTHQQMYETYLHFGYRVVEVPKCSVYLRRDFVMRMIGLKG